MNKCPGFCVLNSMDTNLQFINARATALMLHNILHLIDLYYMLTYIPSNTKFLTGLKSVVWDAIHVYASLIIINESYIY